MEDMPSGNQEAALADLFRGLAAVAQAGLEAGQDATPAVELPDETIDRAGEIFRAQGPQ